MSTLLHVEGISMAFGGLKAVSDFSLRLEAGRLHGLIGPNGAGKTTVFNLLTGVYRPQSGTITLAGRRLNGLRPYQIAEAGMVRTFQNIRLFPDLSVLDNVKIACHLRIDHTMLGAILRSGQQVADEREIAQRSRRLLQVLNLAVLESEYGKNLCYGEQRRLEIARALATRPTVLLLDEPAAGMNPSEKKELREVIRRVLAEFHLTILLIEHDMGVVMDICNRITVLDHGVTIAEGTAAQVQADPKVIEAYLGASVEPAAGQEVASA